MPDAADPGPTPTPAPDGGRRTRAAPSRAARPARAARTSPSRSAEPTTLAPLRRDTPRQAPRRGQGRRGARSARSRRGSARSSTPSRPRSVWTRRGYAWSWRPHPVPRAGARLPAAITLAGDLDPDTAETRALLLHELVHARQHDNRATTRSDLTKAEAEAAGLARALRPGRRALDAGPGAAGWARRARRRRARNRAPTTPDVASLEQELDTYVAANHSADVTHDLRPARTSVDPAHLGEDRRQPAPPQRPAVRRRPRPRPRAEGGRPAQAGATRRRPPRQLPGGVRRRAQRAERRRRQATSARRG